MNWVRVVALLAVFVLGGATATEADLGSGPVVTFNRGKLVVYGVRDIEQTSNFLNLHYNSKQRIRVAQVGQIPAWPPTQPLVVTFSGLGNVYSTSALTYASCADGYTAAVAATLAAVCDVTDTATGLVNCTLHLQASGSTTITECNGVGQSCQTACRVKKMYEQVSGGVSGGYTNATLANMPDIIASALNGKIGIQCNGANVVVTSVSTASQSLPLTWTAVGERTGNFTTSGAYVETSGGSSGSGTGLRTSASTNQVAVFNAAVSLQTKTASDSAFHSLVGAIPSGSGGIIAVDGSDSASGVTGATNLTGVNIRICRTTGAVELTGQIMEVSAFGSLAGSTDRTNIYNNVHTRYGI